MKNTYFNPFLLIFIVISTSSYSMQLDNSSSEDSVKKEYFRDVPQKYHKIIEVNLNNYKNDSSKHPKHRRMYHLHAIASQEQYKVKDKPFYTYLKYPSSESYTMLCRRKCNSFCTGESSADDGYTSLSLKHNYQQATDKSILFKNLTQDYKIHLMPKGCMFEDFDALFHLIKNDEELKKAIVSFKILNDFIDDKQIEKDFNEGKSISPKIVIYVAAGKENAQLVLNKIYAAFKDKEGLNISPRFNQKITSYIYYAQGNGDDKEIDQYKYFFENPGMVHYKSDITGEEENYALKMPTTAWQFMSQINTCYAVIVAYWKHFVIFSLSFTPFIIYKYWMQKK